MSTGWKQIGQVAVKTFKEGTGAGVKRGMCMGTIAKGKHRWTEGECRKIAFWD